MSEVNEIITNDSTVSTTSSTTNDDKKLPYTISVLDAPSNGKVYLVIEFCLLNWSKLVNN